MLAIQQYLSIPAPVRFFILMAAIFAVSREPLRGRPTSPLLSIMLGLVVFAIWIGPDLIAPAWRTSILFNNPVVGHPAGNTPPALKNDPVFLLFRIAISVIAVPILEELFWRGWLMRWLIDSDDFRRVPLGKYAPMAFWVTALLFASEHGSFWDVGLATGAIYNWWMVRTRNLWDCIVAHAVTNAALAAWVVLGDNGSIGFDVIQTEPT
jgi:CAAX prenyl protease-like protein